MKYFLDTEFMESPGSLDLLSIGIVAEDGREFYAEVADADYSKANPWVQKHVLPQLIPHEVDTYGAYIVDGDRAVNVLPLKDIGPLIQQFIGDDKPEFWGYYADYDWVVFCWLFGAMVDLPSGWPMYCRDIKQWVDRLGNPKLPKSLSMPHNALVDARWHKDLYEHLEALERKRTL